MSRPLSALVALAVLSASAFADRDIQASRTFQTGPAVVSSTLDVHPQIQPPGPVGKRIEENEYPLFRVTEPVNSLRPGGMLTTKRSTPKKTIAGTRFTGYVQQHSNRTN
jgi:hypothetical protein